jgi:hypothetical protein
MSPPQPAPTRAPRPSTAVAIFREEEQSENQRDSLSIVGIGLTSVVRKNITNFAQRAVYK